MWLDGSDPASFGPLLFQRPPAGFEPKNIFQSEGFTDRYTPNVAIRAFATSMGVSQVSPVIEPLDGLALRGLQVLTPPVSDNVNGVTGVLLQYDEAQGSDGHFVLFDIAAGRLQSSEFIGSLASTGTATIVVP
jgi:hypothetical protein